MHVLKVQYTQLQTTEESQTQEQQNLSDHTDDSDEEQVDNDDHNVSEALEHEESQTQEQETVCETTECLSCCCADKTKAYQPTDKAILSSMANGGRDFMERWYKYILG